jgi:hypothetical protein
MGRWGASGLRGLGDGEVWEGWGVMRLGVWGLGSVGDGEVWGLGENSSIAPLLRYPVALLLRSSFTSLPIARLDREVYC